VVTRVLVEFVVLEETGASSAKSITCMPGGTVDLAFVFFRLRSSLSDSLSPFLRFEGLAPRTNMVRRKTNKQNLGRTSKTPRLPCIAAPIRILHDSEALDLPVPVTVAKFVKVPLQKVCEVGSSLRSLFCPRNGVKSEAIELIPSLLCSRHKHFDPRFRDWVAIIISEKSEPWRVLPALSLFLGMLDPEPLSPIWNFWVIFLI
jgi:hypothetical protein